MVKQSKPSDPDQYTKPQLRDSIKKKITAGNKGGKPGQWSARKAQLLATEYEHSGGGYKKPKTAPQKSLETWGDEKWKTSDGKKAQRAGGTTRYLPEKAWSQLTEKQKAETNRRKKEGSRQGKQFVSNPKPAAAARKKASAKITSTAGPRKRASTKPAKKAAKKKTAPRR